MLGRIFTVGGYTLLSRLTGFARDIMLAAILGAGPVADAFFVAFRLPNHFRAIFAEGAFNAAFVPAYAHVYGEHGEEAAGLFANRIFTLLFLSQLVLLVAAWLFMPQAMSLLAPGFTDDAEQRRLAIDLTRITFPYLLLITLVTLYGGMLNVMHRFASAAAASIFLNLAMMMTLALAAFFPTAGHAAAWGVLISGFLQYFLLAGDLARHGGLPRFAPLKLDEDVRAFFRALGPATVGSMGTQVALFADTIIATFLPAGALSALYYADRLNQLPIGVIGIAIGTVLLPEMSRQLTAEDHRGAMASQRRAFDFTLLFSVPFVAAFLTVPNVITRAMFARRVLEGGCRRRRRDARGLCRRADPVRADPQRGCDLLRPQGHGDAGEGGADRGRRQRRIEDRAGGLIGAGRPCARDRRRRLDQSSAGDRLRGAGGLPRSRSRPDAIARKVRRLRRRAGGGAVADRKVCCAASRPAKCFS
jgi:putative peptidoglycan lipid II flippase